MIFRIEDNQNPDGNHRIYEIPIHNLPLIGIDNLEKYVVNEILKEVNNYKQRTALSYSKSLGICLLKYNQYTFNELHINTDIDENHCGFVNILVEDKIYYIPFSIRFGLFLKKNHNFPYLISLYNYAIDISDNEHLNDLFQDHYFPQKKKFASPQKDHEIVLMQSPNDLIIEQFLPSIYLLFSLALKYGFSKCQYDRLVYKIRKIDRYRFNDDKELHAILKICAYLSNPWNIQFEKNIILDISKNSQFSMSNDSNLLISAVDNSSWFTLEEVADYVYNYQYDVVSEAIIDIFIR